MLRGELARRSIHARCRYLDFNSEKDLSQLPSISSFLRGLHYSYIIHSEHLYASTPNVLHHNIRPNEVNSSQINNYRATSKTFSKEYKVTKVPRKAVVVETWSADSRELIGSRPVERDCVNAGSTSAVVLSYDISSTWGTLGGVRVYLLGLPMNPKIW